MSDENIITQTSAKVRRDGDVVLRDGLTGFRGSAALDVSARIRVTTVAPPPLVGVRN